MTPAPKTMQVSEPQVWSVSRLNTLVRDTLLRERHLQRVWVKGEVFNLNRHPSGHIYFSLKDDRSVLNCTFFKNSNARFRDVPLQDGMELQAQGSVSVYLPRGSYQLNVTAIMAAGEGALRLKIDELKRRLHTEGLFNAERKRPLPTLPRTLGIATAATGAAVRDIIQVARRRFPRVNILLAPCTVQGRGAAASIIRAIELLNRPEYAVDVIIAGRGGGSFDDLLAFSEEAVVRSYAASRLPIVSAVGHEIDSPVSDLAADAFAPTPSAAAELAIPELAGWLEFLEDCALRLQVSLRNRYRNEKARLEFLLGSAALQSPKGILESSAQSLDLVWRELQSAMRVQVQGARVRMGELHSLSVAYRKQLATREHRFGLAAERLQNFNPLAVLGRGYAIARKADGVIVRAATDVQAGEELSVLLGRGSLRVAVQELEPEANDSSGPGRA